MTSERDGRDILAAHVAECDECRAEPLPVDELGALLRGGAIDLAAERLSAATLALARPELYRRAARAWWRRVILGVIVSLLPLPAVALYDSYVLRGVYAVASMLLPESVATLVALSYAALLVLLFATTYAAIPLMLPRQQQAVT